MRLLARLVQSEGLHVNRNQVRSRAISPVADSARWHPSGPTPANRDHLSPSHSRIGLKHTGASIGTIRRSPTPPRRSRRAERRRATTTLLSRKIPATTTASVRPAYTVYKPSRSSPGLIWRSECSISTNTRRVVLNGRGRRRASHVSPVTCWARGRRRSAGVLLLLLELERLHP